MSLPNEIVEKALTLHKEIDTATLAWKEKHDPHPVISLLQEAPAVITDKRIMEIIGNWFLAGKTDWIDEARFPKYERRDKDNLYKQRLCWAIKDLVEEHIKEGMSTQQAIQAVADRPEGLGFMGDEYPVHWSYKQVERYYYKDIKFCYYLRIIKDRLVLRIEPSKTVINGAKLYGRSDIPITICTQ